MTRFVLPIEPRPAARPRARKGGHGYYPAGYTAWLEAASLMAKVAWRKAALTVPVRVALTLRPSSIVVDIEPSEFQRGKIRGDIDNIGKAVADALVRGGVLADDAQVVDLTVRMEG